MPGSGESIKPAEILRKSGPYLVPGKIKLTEWAFSVPLRHDDPSSPTIRLFAQSGEKAEDGHIHQTAAPAPTSPAALSASLSVSTSSSSASSASSSSQEVKPWLFYQQGGPGFGCSSPQDAPFTRFFLDKGYRVMLIDQRGTGQSTTLTAQTLALQGNAEQQAKYAKLFRADNIVRDTEAVRLALTADVTDESKRRIAVLGQSFGGFVGVSYLSMFPDGLREVFLTGGLPPLGQDIDDVYRVHVQRAAERSAGYYRKYPEDEKVIKELIGWIKEQNQNGAQATTTASGGRLTEARLRALGMYLGFSGGFTTIHNLVTRLKNDLENFGFWTRPTMDVFEGFDQFDDAIMYAILHEPIYLDGPGRACNWSAERAIKASNSYGSASADAPVSLTVEMITHDTITDHPELRQLQEVANILSQDTDWPHLYDEKVLSNNSVPVFAAVYHDDLYVNFDFSLSTASKIKGAKVFITNRAYHDGLKAETGKVLEELFALRDDTLD